MMDFAVTVEDTTKKAPLCKGSWHGEAVTEGLSKPGRLQPLRPCGAPPLTQGRLLFTEHTKAPTGHRRGFNVYSSAGQEMAMRVSII